MLTFDVWETSTQYNNFTHFRSFLNYSNSVTPKPCVLKTPFQIMMDNKDNLSVHNLYDAEYGMDNWFWALSSEQYLNRGYDSVLGETPVVLSLCNLHFRAVYSAPHDVSCAQIKDVLLTPVLQKFYLKNSNALGVTIFLNKIDDNNRDPTILRFSLDLILLFDAEQPLKSSLIKTILIPQDYNTCYLCSLKITTISNDNWHWHRILYNQFWHNPNVMTNTCNFIHSVHYNYGPMPNSPFLIKHTLMRNYMPHLKELLSEQLSNYLFSWTHYTVGLGHFYTVKVVQEHLERASSTFAVLVPNNPYASLGPYWRIFLNRPKKIVELLKG